MTATQRLVLNTVATYLRTVLAAGLGLFSSRWVLNSLGQTDFGLFSVVGSLIIFVTFLNNVMAASAARHFAFAIGQRDRDEVNKWFNAALSTHLFFPIALIIIGWPIGEYCIVHVLTIPPDRVKICTWVFRLSLVSAYVSMASIPFVAMFRAKQNIAELALWETLQSVCTFTLALSLSLATGDRLLFFAAGMVAIPVFIQSVLVCRALFAFPECRIKVQLWFNAVRIREIFGFASWSLIGMSGGLLRNQGSAILLNLYFGPSVNAAYGIANQVTAQAGNLSSAMFGAFSPEITSSEGRGDRGRMLDLSQRASKFGTLLMLFFSVPLIVEMENILKLWLVEPPMYTAMLCQLMVGTFLLDRLSVGYMSAVSAYGKVAGYQATIGSILFMTLPLAWLFLSFGAPPTSVGLAFVLIQVLCSLGRVLWVRHLFGVSVRGWLMAIVWPCSIVAIVTVLSAMVPVWLMPATLYRLLFVCMASAIATALTSWFFALDKRERAFFLDNVKKIFGSIQMKLKTDTK